MSTPEQGTGQAPALPTPQDAEAIFNRAAQAAERAETAAQRLEEAQQAASSETASRFPNMPQEMVDAIASKAAETVVSALNAQYELQGRTPPAPGPQDAENGGASSSGSGSPPAAASSSDAGGSPPSSPTSEPASFRNIAHRVLGY